MRGAGGLSGDTLLALALLEICELPSRKLTPSHSLWMNQAWIIRHWKVPVMQLWVRWPCLVTLSLCSLRGRICSRQTRHKLLPGLCYRAASFLVLHFSKARREVQLWAVWPGGESFSCMSRCQMEGLALSDFVSLERLKCTFVLAAVIYLYSTIIRFRFSLHLLIY